jgi:hypothetical protein
MIEIDMITASRGSMVGEGAAHRRRQHGPGLLGRLGDELEEQRQLADRHLAARLIGQRQDPVVAAVLRRLVLEDVERVDLAAVGDAAVHLLGEAQLVLVVLDREQRPLPGQRLERDREGVLRRLPDGHVGALADEALLDDLAAEQDADAEDAAAGRSGRCRRRCVALGLRGRHQKGAFFTEASTSGRKSCLRFSHS